MLFEIAVVCIVGAICLLFMEPIVVLLGLATYFLVYWLLQIKAKVIEPWRKHLAADKQAAAYRQAVVLAETARIQHVESSEVVEVPHDEGTIYLFSVGDDRIYWTDPEHACKQWPNTNFEMLEVAGWDEEIGPICYGERLTVRETIHFTDFDFEKLSTGRLIERSLDTFLQEARRKPH